MAGRAGGRTRRRTRLALAAVAAALLGACEFNTTAIVPPAPQVVLHLVLNPGFTQQMMLLERSLTGTADMDATRFDPSDPIVSGGGVPIVGATAVLQSEAGNKWTAADVGGGVYVFVTPPSARLVPGHRYTLRVQTYQGEVVTGETTIPQAAPVTARSPRRFDRERDTLALEWGAAPLARTYALRVDTPTGPFFLFTDSLSARLPGTLRNLFSDGIPSVFIPGFRQVVTVSAVDANYFDYYRSRSDAFTGRGQIMRLQGALGFFGALVNLRVERLDVVAPFRTHPEGEWILDRGPGPRELHLWIERPATTSAPALVTGRFISTLRPDPGAMIGSFAGNQLALTLLNAQLVNDTLGTFRGTVYPDSLVGVFVQGEESVYYPRAAAPLALPAAGPARQRQRSQSP